MNIVIAAHSPARSLLPIGSFHLAGAWARAGHRVVHLDPPLSPFHLARLGDPQLRARLRRNRGSSEGWVSVTQWALAPQAILERGPGLTGAHLAARAPRLRAVLSSLGAVPVDLLVVDNPYAVGLAPRVAAGRSAYRATDVYWKLRDSPRLAELERRVIHEVDALVATSAPVAEHLTELSGGRDVVIVPNGARHSGRPIERAGRPRAVYAGALDERFDEVAFGRLVATHPDVAFHLVGGGPKERAVEPAPNLVVHGWMAHDDLLDLLVTATVGVLPLSAATANDGRSPIKVFEYLAAGAVVVASTTAELRRLDLPRVRLAADTDELVHQFGEALGDPVLEPEALARLRGDLSWDGRALQVLAAAGVREAAT